MVPIADLINHDKEKQCAWQFNEAKNGFEIIALKKILKGDQITLSYGKNKVNTDMFINYGFIDDKSSYEILIEIDLKTYSPNLK